MRVLAISYGKNFFTEGNAERARQTACAAEAGEMHAIVFSHQQDNLESVVIADCLHLHPTNSKNSFAKVTDAIALGKKIIRESPGDDWVITAQDPFEAGLVAWRIAAATGVPFNLQEHGDFFSTHHWRNESLHNRVRFVVGKFLLRKANSVRVVSMRTKKTLEALGVRTDNISMLSVRTDTAHFTNAKLDPSLIPDYDPKALYVLTVARLVAQKNLRLLIDAFAEAQAIIPNARLVIFGHGVEEEMLASRAKALCGDTVLFCDWTDSVPAVMATADLYALSSNYEGWGRVLIEAQAAGLPIVTTDVGCVGEAVLESTACQIVPVGDTRAFSEALVNQLKNSEEAKRAAKSIASNLSLSEVSESAYAQEWVTILKNTQRSTL